MGLLPTLEQIENSVHRIENKLISDHQKVADELEPLIKYIDFSRIKGRILIDIIKPLDIIPAEIIQQNGESINSDLNDIRGIPLYRFDNIFDEFACGSELIIEDNGKVVRAPKSCGKHQNVRAKIICENKGIFEWDVIIEKYCGASWVGVCSSENLNYETFAGSQLTGWVLGSYGCCYNSGNRIYDYCPSFRDGAKITVHLDMNKRTCAFTVNGTKYPEVSGWNNLPSKLYPVVTIKYPGRLRIQSHQKI